MTCGAGSIIGVFLLGFFVGATVAVPYIFWRIDVALEKKP